MPLTPLRDEVLHAVDLLDLVLVGGNGRHVPAELLGAGADAAQHGDVERVVVLGERDADGDLLLGRGGGGRERGGQQQGGREQDATGCQHGVSPVFVSASVADLRPRRQ